MAKLFLLFLLFASVAVQGQSEQDRLSLMSRYEKFAATAGRVTAVNKQYIGRVKEWQVEVRKVTDVRTDSSLLGINFFFRQELVRFSFFIDADELSAVMDMLLYAQQVLDGKIKDKTYVDMTTSNGVNLSVYYYAGLYIKTWYLVCRQVYPGTNIKAYEEMLQVPAKELDHMIELIRKASAALPKL